MATRGKRQNGNGGKARQRKDGRWTADVSYTDPQTGKLVRTSVYGKTEADVEEKRRAALSRAHSGRPITDSKALLETFTEQWIAGPLEISDRKPTTKQLYAGLARKHVVGSRLGSTPLANITTSGVERWVAGLKREGLSQSTIRTTYTVLRAILAVAVRDKLLQDNPAAAMPRPKVDHHEAQYLTPAQVRLLLEAAGSSRYRPLFELLVHTAMRRGEALALRWEDIDEDQRVIRIRGTLARVGGKLTVIPPKTRSGRREIPLSSATTKVLKEIKLRTARERLKAGSQWGGAPFVFLTELGEPVEPRNALRALATIVQRHNTAVDQRNATLPVSQRSDEDKLPAGIGVHTLRHSAASAMLTAGIPMLTVSRICGHQSIEITADNYGHVAPDLSLGALETLSERISG